MDTDFAVPFIRNAGDNEIHHSLLETRDCQHFSLIRSIGMKVASWAVYVHGCSIFMMLAVTLFKLPRALFCTVELEQHDLQATCLELSLVKHVLQSRFDICPLLDTAQLLTVCKPRQQY